MNVLPRCSRLLPLRVAPREEALRHRGRVLPPLRRPPCSRRLFILPRCSRLLPLRVAPREEELRHRPVRVQGALVGVGRVQGQVALSSLAALAVRAGAREVREEADQGEEGVRARGGGAEPTLGRASHGKDRLRSEVQFR